MCNARCHFLRKRWKGERRGQTGSSSPPRAGAKREHPVLLGGGICCVLRMFFFDVFAASGQSWLHLGSITGSDVNHVNHARD